MRKFTEACIPSVSFASAGAGGVVVGHKPAVPARAPIAKAHGTQRALVHRTSIAARPTASAPCMSGKKAGTRPAA